MSTRSPSRDVQYTLRDDGFLFSEAYLTGGNRETAENYLWPVPVFQRLREDTAATIGHSGDVIRPGDILEYCGGDYEEYLLVVAILPTPAKFRPGLEIANSDRILCYSSNSESYRLFLGGAFINLSGNRLDHETGEYVLHEDAAPLIEPSTNIPADVTHPPCPEILPDDGNPSAYAKENYPHTHPPERAIRLTTATAGETKPIGEFTNEIHHGDACEVLATIPTSSVHAWITSPPYYSLRDYDVDGQIGREGSVTEYLESIMAVVNQLMRVTRNDGLGALVVDDAYQGGSVKGIPHRLHQEITKQGFEIVHHAPWTKPNGKPDAATNRYSHRHEHILIIAHDGGDHYFHKQASADPTDVFDFAVGTSDADHDAIYPIGLPKELIRTTVPEKVCPKCGAPYEEQYEVTDIRNLPSDRPQAQRALELASRHDLTDDHLRALRSVGLGHTGQAKRTQSGTGNNTDSVEQLATEAEDALGSYAREFTNPNKELTGHIPSCSCETDTEAKAGIVVDPFFGSGTTGRAAKSLRRRWIGIELNEDYIATAQSRIGVDVSEPDRLTDENQNTLTNFV
ncbi:MULTISPECIES: DNA-methyltransferase [Haloferacaceae]|uniref:site-specific DNA-methyltransferase (cytosine-N(4)-specific) n=2 Tax=Haloferacaceae TaxID=1644056 RepID=A0ABD6DDL3_9EURY|nr:MULTISPECIES: site-specific DNA-methyltransferase [Halorubraceae]